MKIKIYKATEDNMMSAFPVTSLLMSNVNSGASVEGAIQWMHKSISNSLRIADFGFGLMPSGSTYRTMMHSQGDLNALASIIIRVQIEVERSLMQSLWDDMPNAIFQSLQPYLVQMDNFWVSNDDININDLLVDLVGDIDRFSYHAGLLYQYLNCQEGWLDSNDEDMPCDDIQEFDRKRLFRAYKFGMYAVTAIFTSVMKMPSEYFDIVGGSLYVEAR